MAVQAERTETRDAFLDAAERLLVEVGYAGITSRRLAEEAGANQGLVYYYFGSMEEMFLEVLERYTGRLTERQRAMYAADLPFIEKWRTAMRYLVEDRRAGYQKIWLELQAMAWNHPEMRARVARVHGEWQAVLLPAFRKGLRELGVDSRKYPVEAVVALAYTFNEGVMLEGLLGVDTGHGALLDMIDRLLVRLDREQSRGQAR